jgi:multidrug efflux system outer membrane protein
VALMARAPRNWMSGTVPAAPEVPRAAVPDQAQRAFGLIESEYQAGAQELLVVLDAQRTLLSSEDELSQVRLARLRAAAGLAKALGGGWSRE